MSQVAKLFMNGRSQAVRLPASCRFEGKEVFVRRDPASGDVILSKRPHNWDSFFRALDGAEIPKEFLGPEQRDHGQHDRDVFASQRPPNWDAFKAAVENLEVPDDFLSERELDRGAPLDRDPFAGWDE